MTTNDKNKLTVSEIMDLLYEVDPDDLDEETLFFVQEFISLIVPYLEQESWLDETLKNLSSEDESKVRATFKRLIQWRNNRTIN